MDSVVRVPIISEFATTSTIKELDNLKDKTIQAMRAYEDEHQLNNETLTWKVAGVIAEKYILQKNMLETKNHQMAKLFKFN